jgi:hypothetical protein
MAKGGVGRCDIVSDETTDFTKLKQLYPKMITLSKYAAERPPGMYHWIHRTKPETLPLNPKIYHLEDFVCIPVIDNLRIGSRTGDWLGDGITAAHSGQISIEDRVYMNFRDLDVDIDSFKFRQDTTTEAARRVVNEFQSEFRDIPVVLIPDRYENNVLFKYHIRSIQTEGLKRLLHLNFRIFAYPPKPYCRTRRESRDVHELIIERSSGNVVAKPSLTSSDDMESGFGSIRRPVDARSARDSRVQPIKAYPIFVDARPARNSRVQPIKACPIPVDSTPVPPKRHRFPLAFPVGELGIYADVLGGGLLPLGERLARLELASQLRRNTVSAGDSPEPVRAPDVPRLSGKVSAKPKVRSRSIQKKTERR